MEMNLTIHEQLTKVLIKYLQDIYIILIEINKSLKYVQIEI